MILRKVVMSSKQNFNIAFFGVENVGKTSLLNDLKHIIKEDPVLIAPTRGKNVLKMKHHGKQLLFQDMGGSSAFRKFWENYFTETDIVVFVFDASTDDPKRLEESRFELQQLVQTKALHGAAFLICANKMDKVSEVTVCKKGEDFVSYWKLNELFDQYAPKKTLWRVLETCSGSRLEEVFNQRKENERKQRFGAQSKELMALDDEERSKFPLDAHFGTTGMLVFIDEAAKNAMVKKRAATNKRK